MAVWPYRYPASHKDELERQCTTILERKTSAFSSPVLLIKKADGSWHFGLDYRKALWRSLLHQASGYHQVRMNAVDVKRTTFQTHDGLYEFLIMPFGLSNASATFRALMNDVLRPFLRCFVLVFFNGILIYSSSWVEHLCHVRAVLTVLQH